MKNKSSTSLSKSQRQKDLEARFPDRRDNGKCRLCDTPTNYRNGFCGPCWNSNYDNRIPKDLAIY